MQLKPFELQTSRLKLSGLTNGVTKGRPVVAIHGWLDNAASFIPLSEELVLDRPFFAVEMPGHGWSEHRPSSANYHLVDNVVDIIAFIDAVCEQCNPLGVSDEEGVACSPVTIVGHSLGGIVGTFLSASVPERVDKLILLDSLGPLTDQIEDVLPQLRKAVAQAARLRPSRKTVFPDESMAIKARMMGVGRVSSKSATLLVERGMVSCEGGYQWRSDPKLLAPSMVRFTEKQVKAILSGVECPVYLLFGDRGFFVDNERVRDRIACFKSVSSHELQGGHHFHMDGDVRATARLIEEIIQDV